MVAVCCALITTTNNNDVSTPATKYPLEVHRMFRDRLERNKTPQVAGSWSAWSPWSTCSRTCGGGVTHQIRHCITKPMESRTARKHRRRREHKGANQCVGLYKRYHICNTQKCPTARDFRAEQCALYNNRPFRGKVYVWEPFLKASQECALNCRAAGMDFYATLNKTVVDGTPCNNPFTFLGKPAPKGTTGVCVDGQCKTVGLNGVIGSSTEEFTDAKQCCLETRCKGYSGLFTKENLSAGYSSVTPVPKGACRLIVRQMKISRNFIALRYLNGTYFLNGNHKYTPTGEINAAGTKFIYRRQEDSRKESVAAVGAIEYPVEIMLLSQQLNSGIEYEYYLPEYGDILIPASPLLPKRVNIATNYSHPVEPKYKESTNFVTHQRDEAKPNIHRRNRYKRKFIWEVRGLTACTRTCGGGTQSTILVCVRENNRVSVNDSRCKYAEKPPMQTKICNPQPCPPSWGGIWSQCSATCGPGVQLLNVVCQQEIGPFKTVHVNESVCMSYGDKPIAKSRTCHIMDCESDNEVSPVSSSRSKPLDVPSKSSPTWDQKEFVDWDIGPWSACSSSCGGGFRQRLVSCQSGRCDARKRPYHSERCDAGPCPSNPSSRESTTASTSASGSNYSHKSFWLVTEWSQCSALCGTGTQSRMVACVKPQCHHTPKPETERQCSSDRHCGEWYTGPWGRCPDTCSGSAKQKRDVLCVVKIRGSTRIVSDATCSDYQKPATEQDCPARCPPRWFLGDWSVCDGNCPDGEQNREVRCLDHNGIDSRACTDPRPDYRRTCFCDHQSSNSNSRNYPPSQSQQPPITSIERNDAPTHRRAGETHPHRAESHHHHHHHHHQNSKTESHTNSRHDSRVNTNEVDAKIQPSLDQPIDPRCVDKFPNCHLAVQARLCQYHYYESHCCMSCRRAPPGDPTIK